MVNCHAAVCCIGLMIGFFGLMMASGQSIQRKLWVLNNNYKIEKDRLKIRQELCDVINLHSQVKELSLNCFP